MPGNCRSFISIQGGGRPTLADTGLVGVGMGYSQPAGMMIVADGTLEAARRLERVLWNDAATDAMHHADADADADADAGHDAALDCELEQILDLPGIPA